MSAPGLVAKRCSVCELVKSANEFYRDRTSRDGLGSRCKVCDDARDRRAHDARKYQRRKAEKTDRRSE